MDMTIQNTLRALLSAALLFLSITLSSLNYSYTFTSKVWNGWGTQNLNGVNWDLQGTNDTYFGYDGIRGQQIGSKNNYNEWISIKTSDFTGRILSVKLEVSGTSGVSATVQVKVGGVNLSPETAPLSSLNIEYEFTGSAVGELEIYIQSNTQSGLYIKKINIVYSDEIIDYPSVLLEEIVLDFVCDYDVTDEREIAIEAFDLVADIQANIIGEDQNKFYYNFAESFNFRTGGVILVGYNPNFEEDFHVASLVLTSEGATPKEIELNGVARAKSAVQFPEENIQVWTEKNKINFYASEGDVIELVTLTGQTILQTTAHEGLNAIHIQAKGILIIKIADKATKIIM